MFNLSFVVCVKMRSNSGRKLLDNQLEYIAIENNIPLIFLEEMRETNYGKIYFEKIVNNETVTIKPIAYADTQNLIYFFEKYKKTPEILKAQISILESVLIPKESVNPQNKKTPTKNELISKEQKSKKMPKSLKNESDIKSLENSLLKTVKKIQSGIE